MRKLTDVESALLDDLGRCLDTTGRAPWDILLALAHKLGYTVDPDTGNIANRPVSTLQNPAAPRSLFQRSVNGMIVE